MLGTHKKAHRQSRCAWWWSAKRGLEHQLHSHLQLAGRTGVAGWEASARNLTKGGASNYAAGLAIVRMVEQVERVSAELNIHPLGKLCILHQRQIKVLEVRTNKRVAPNNTEVISRRNEHARIGKPVLQRITGNDRSSGQVWPDGVTNSRDR